jgi:hypothetical protein
MCCLVIIVQSALYWRFVAVVVCCLLWSWNVSISGMKKGAVRADEAQTAIMCWTGLVMRVWHGCAAWRGMRCTQRGGSVGAGPDSDIVLFVRVACPAGGQYHGEGDDGGYGCVLYGWWALMHCRWLTQSLGCIICMTRSALQKDWQHMIKRYVVIRVFLLIWYRYRIWKISC